MSIRWSTMPASIYAAIPRGKQIHESQQAIDSQHVPLLSRDVTDNLQVDWQSVQASFVDEPHQAVQRADELVAFAIKQIAETFARERSTLEAQWDLDGDVSTEDLRGHAVQAKNPRPFHVWSPARL